MTNKRNGLRPVTFKLGGEMHYGYFHSFIQSQAFTYAIVETKDGEVDKVLYDNIVFQDISNLANQEDKPLNKLELAELVANRIRISTEDMLTIIEGVESGYNLKDNPIYAIASRDRKIKELQNILDEKEGLNIKKSLDEGCVVASTKDMDVINAIYYGHSDEVYHRNVSDENLSLWSSAIQDTTKEPSEVVEKSLKSILSGLEKLQEKIDSHNTSSSTAKATTTKSEYLLETLASEWNSLSAQKKLSIATSVSGRYQTARFIALIDELSKIHDSET